MINIYIIYIFIYICKFKLMLNSNINNITKERKKKEI